MHSKNVHLSSQCKQFIEVHVIKSSGTRTMPFVWKLEFALVKEFQSSQI